MKALSSTTGLEVDIEPFIINLDSSSSTASLSPNSDTDKYPTTQFETLAQDPTINRRVAVLRYLPLAPVVQQDIPAFLPAFLDDEEVMIALATNIAYYHSQDFISDSELEYLLLEVLVCRNREGILPYIMDDKILHFYHFLHWQIQQFRNAYVSKLRQLEQEKFQRKLKNAVKLRDKHWKRKRAEARKIADPQWCDECGVPLPYGCTTIFDVFADVNEMCNPSAAPHLPLDWAQSRPHSNENRGIYASRPRVKLPVVSADILRPQTRYANVLLAREGRWFSRTRMLFEPLSSYTKQKSVDIIVKLPRADKHILPDL